ncbi:hypothetical protein KIN20_025493 [Parelaphostrongylus tenuis]|uniref:Uncharacterized protein n=1 Tax=Parelaphostrongylus tenuis TaxID=148309 RepID=A0AAD5NDD6_PARTN|nr:hypothetical protein KIN20_025493 [Parelaphostrongylus tenuis]
MNSRIEKEAVISGVGVGAVSVAGGGIRLLLRESASVQSAIAKGTVHAAIGISIAIDLLTVLLSVKDIMKGSRSEMAEKLRNIARELKSSREEIKHLLLLDPL